MKKKKFLVSVFYFLVLCDLIVNWCGMLLFKYELMCLFSIVLFF